MNQMKPASPCDLCSDACLGQVVCALYSAAAMYSNMMFLPFYKPVMNIANILHSGCFTSATVFLTCAYVRGIPEVCTSSLVCGNPMTLAHDFKLRPRHWHAPRAAVVQATACWFVNCVNCPNPRSLQNNAEAMGFMLSLPVVLGVSYIGYRLRYKLLQSPQVVHDPYMVSFLYPLCALHAPSASVYACKLVEYSSFIRRIRTFSNAG